METSSSEFVFFECSNASCNLRFPLDVKIFNGSFCPRCGSPLERQEVGILAQKPASVPNSDTRVIGVLDNIRSAQNVGAIFRTADGASVSELLLGGITPSPEQQAAISKTSLGAENSVAWSYHPNTLKSILTLQAQGCLVLALESTPNARPLQDFQLEEPKPKQIALVVGNEPAGVDPAILQAADQVLYIPMSGTKTSLNVSVAFGIAVYHLLWLTAK